MKKISTLTAALLLFIASAFAQTPVASFTYTPACVLAGDTVHFTNTSTNYVANLWRFGDPGSLTRDTSTLKSAAHLFSTTGTFIVTLFVTNGTVIDSVKETITVIGASISPATDTICRGATPVNTTLTASGGGTYAWSNGGGTNAAATFAPFATTTYTVTVTGAPGCSATASRTVVVNRAPTATITPATASTCAGHSVTLTASGGVGATGLTYLWSSGSDSATAIVSPATTTSYTVTVSEGSCTAIAMVTVTVANFTPTITPATDTICSGAGATLTATGGLAGTTYSWSNSLTTAAITVNPTSNNTYSVTATETGGCTGSASATVVVRGSISAAITPAHDTICSGTGQTVTLTASGGGTYAWSNGLGTSGAVTVTPLATTTYTVTVTNGNCTATASAQVVVNRTPTATITPPTPTVCSGHSIVLTANPGVGITGVTYLWSSGSDSSTTTVTPTATTAYTVTISNGGNCTATTTTTVTVESFTPGITPAADTICNGNSATLTATGGGVGSLYRWSTGSLLVTTTVTPATTTSYTVSVTETNGCSGTATATVVVRGAITATVTPATDTICSGQNATLTASGGTTYVWSSGQRTAAITVAPTATTTYTVTASVGTGCTASATAVVTVKPSPVAAIAPAGPVNICSGQSVRLTASGGGTYVWSTGSDSAGITVSPATNSTYSVTVTGANGCTAAATANVGVTPAPAAAIAPATASVCAGGSITLTASGAGFGGGGYAWSTGANTAAITVSPAITTTYMVTVTAGLGGCSATASRTVTVDTVPVVSIVPATDTICAGQTTTLIATGGPNYTWSNGALSQATIVTPTATTQYKVTVTNSNNCSASDSVNVVVKNIPAVVIAPGNTAICIGNSATLSATGGGTYSWSNGGTTASITVSPVVSTIYDVTVTGANGCSAADSVIVLADTTLTPVIAPRNPVVCSGDSVRLTVTAGATYSWSNGSTAQHIVVSPEDNTTYTVTVTNGNGCSGTASVNVSVFNQLAVFISPSPDSVCAGQSTTLTASGGTSYRWNTGDTTAAVTVSPAVTTTYKVLVTGAGGCTAVDSVTVKVNPVPTVTIGPGGPPVTVCAGTDVVLTAAGAGVGGTFTYSWSNGNDSAAITVAPTATTTYTVTATNSDGCSASASKIVTVTAPPVVTITPATDTICSGQNTTLTANGGTGVTYAWSTGGGGFGPSVTVAPTVTTTYRVTVTPFGPGACAATDSVKVVVKTSPVATITPATEAICGGHSATLTASGGISYSWSSGSDSSTTTVTPVATTTYTVTVTGANGCSATASRVVTVNPAPVAAITPATSSICSGNPVTLNAGAGAFGNTYSWSNGGTTAAITVTPTTTTTYTVTVTNTASGCTATASAVVISNPTLVPVITPSNPTVCAGSAVALTVTAGSSYHWSTGAPTQTINVTPAVTTIYTVTVTNGTGCSGTAAVTVTVVPAVTATITPATVNICAGSSATLTASGGPNFAWSTGGDSASITVTPAGTTTYTVTVSNAAGCSATASRTVTVTPAPILRITPPGPANVCAGGSVTINAAIFGGTGTPTYVWNNGATTAAITVTPAASTTYTVTATNGAGCSVTGSEAVTVNAAPAAAITPAKDTICSGQSATLTASGGGFGFGAYVWSTGARAATITVTPTASTTYVVTVTGTGGCTAVATATVDVKPIPVVTITPAKDTICSGTALNISATGGGTYAWSNTDNTAIIAVQPAATTTYTVTVTGNDGCSASAASTITVNSVAGGIVPPVASICTGQTDTLRAGGTGTYIWSNGNTTASIIVTPASTTVYTLTITGGNNCSASSSATVNVNATLVPIISPSSATLCIGNATTLSVTNGTSYTWSNGATTQSILIAPAVTTTYDVTVNNGGGCSGTASAVVTVDSLPVANINPATAAICRGSSTNLTASGGATYAWSTNSTLATITVSPGATTTYTVTVTNAGGCSATASRVVTVNPPPVAGITPGAINICLGANTTLTAHGGATYSWNNGSTAAAITVSPLVTTTYTVTASSAAGCTATAAATVTVNTVSASITPVTDTICNGGTTTLTASGGTGYRWNNGVPAASVTVAPTVTTTYTVTVTTAGGCSATASRTVNVIVPVATITPLTDSICKGSTTTLTANGGTTYAWNVGAHSQSITISPIVTTNYTVTATNNQGCTATATRAVVVKANPVISVNPLNDTVCGGSPATITVIGTGSYTWSTGATSQIITVTPASSTNYTVTLTGTDGCTATATSDVTVKPISASINPAVSSLCTGMSDTLTASGGSTYSWSNGGTTATIIVTPNATTNYTVTVSGSGCTETATATVNIGGTLTPIITPANPAVCQGGSVTLVVTAGTSYSWNGGATSESITVSPNSPASYSVTVSNGVGCTGTATVNVAVNSNPTAVVTPVSDTICTGQGTSFTASGGTGYSWSNSATTTTINVHPLNTATYIVTVTNANNCSATASGTVTVLGFPSATISPSSDSICSGLSAALTASGGGTYSWSTGSTNAGITVSPGASTTYIVTVTSGGSCSASASVVVTVKALPTASAGAAPTAICNGGTATLTASGGVDYEWNTDSSSVSFDVSPASTTSYTVTVTGANGCTASATTSVTVNSLPNAQVSPDTANICTGGTALLTASGGTSYAWSTNVTTAAISVSPAGVSSYSVTVTGSNTCSASAVGVVVVNSNPTVFINPATAAVCQGNSITLTAIGGVTYSWSNSGTADSIVVSPASTTTYTVTATNAANCSASASQAVTVNSNPTASINTSASTICKGGNVTLTASGTGTYSWSDTATSAAITVSPTTTTSYTVTVTSFGTGCTATASSSITVDSVNATISPALSSICTAGNQTITAGGGGTYSWSSGPTSASITVSPVTNTTYTVTITATNTCTATLSATVNVNLFLQPVITPANPVICAGDTASLSVTAGATYSWSNSATTQGILVSPGTTTPYSVTVHDNAGCSGTTSVNVTVNSNPVASISPSTSSICAGQNDSLTAGTGTGYLWSNGSTTSGINVSPLVSGPYAVTVTNSNNCSASATASITVNSLPVALINPSSDTICSGQSARLVATGGTTYSWSDGSTTAIVSEGPLSTSTYFVTVSTSFGCSATASSTITVNQTPVAETTPDTASICAGNSAVFTAYDTTGNANLTFSWSSGATTSDINVSPANSTTYTVTVTANQCQSTATAVLIVNSIPVAAVQPSSTAVCLGDSTNLTATGGDGGYIWSTGDTIATISVTPDLNSTYTVTVTSSAGCTATASASVTVNNPPVANVNPGSAVVCSGQNATFTASGGTAYAWSNNQTTPAITVNPASSTGYAVTVSDANGCSASASAAVVVNVAVVPLVSPNTATICSGQNASFTASSDVSYAWSNGPTTAEITVAPANSITYTVTGTDGNGCTATATASVTVNTSPDAAINPAVSSICSSQSTSLTASGGGTYSWSNSSTGATITITPANTTTYTVIVTGSNNCSASATAVVNVNASLQPVITPSSAAVCLGNSTGLSVTAGVSYQWSNGATTQSIQVSPSATTSYSVTVSNGGVCDGSASANVTVNSNPAVFFTPASSLTICSGENISVTAGGGTGYVWGTGATVADITVSPSATTSYDVTVTDGNGCSSTGAAVVNVNQSSYTFDSLSLCSGSTYNFYGQTLTTSGIYADTLSTVNGCDSIITLQLNITPFITNAYSVTVCGSSSFPFNGQNLTQPGVYYDTLSAVGGCDSIIILTLQFGGTLNTAINTSICQGGEIIFAGAPRTTTGSYTDTLQAVGGCDSIVTLNLTVKPVSNSLLADTICTGSTYNFNGRNITVAGVYKDTLVNSTGCDSIVTLNLLVTPGPVVSWNVNDTICTRGQTTVLIPAASPAGGVYSGTGVSGDSLNTSAGTSPFEITYAIEGPTGCNSTATMAFITESCIIGIDEVSLEQQIKLYPNPTTGLLTVESTLFTADGPVPVVYDVTGNMVETIFDREVGKFTFNTTRLAAGVYFVHFVEQGTSVNMKFVKLD